MRIIRAIRNFEHEMLTLRVMRAFSSVQNLRGWFKYKRQQQGEQDNEIQSQGDVKSR